MIRDWPPPLAMLATTLPHTCTIGETTRILCILGSHGCSTIGELPEAPRIIVHGILRDAKQRKRGRVGPSGEAPLVVRGA
jgi:hypothetical protein